MLDIVDDKNGLVEHLASLVGMKGKMLAIPTDMQEGEALRDTVLRASERNGFRNTKMAVDLAGSRSFKSVAAIPIGPSDEIDRLVNILGIRKDSDAARRMLLEPESSGRDWINFFGINVRRGHLSGARRVSPRSLRLHGRQKAMWSLKPLSFDPETREKLLDHCPVCNRQLGWSRSYGVGFCDICTSPGSFVGAVDLREFPQPVVEVNDDEALRFVTDLVDPERLHAISSVPLHRDLAEQNRGDLFQFAIQLAGVSQRNEGIHSDALNPLCIAKAGRALLGWPDAYDAMIAASKPRSAMKEDPSKDLSNRLRYDPTLSPSVRGLLKSRFEVDLRKQVVRRQQEFGTQVPYQCSVAQPLRQARSELLRLRSNSAPDSEVAVKVLRDAPEARQLSKVLGLPVPFLVELYDDGMVSELTSVLGNFRKARRTHWTTSLLQTLKTAPLVEPSGMVSLAVLSFQMAHMDGKRWVQIFRAMADGRVSVSRGATDKGCDVRNLYIPRTDQLQAVLMGSRQVSATERVPLRQCESGLAMGISRPVVACFIKNDLLPTNPTINDIGDLRKHWMLASEIRTKLLLENRVATQRLRALEKSEVARLSVGLTTLWSRVGACENLGLQTRFHR